MTLEEDEIAISINSHVFIVPMKWCEELKEEDCLIAWKLLQMNTDERSEEAGSNQSNAPLDTSPIGVKQRVEGIINDAIRGRLSGPAMAPQRRAIKGAIERADRDTVEGDNAIGRISSRPNHG